jgi:hypothetical protein
MKNIQKSIRMSQEIYEYIAAFDGKNFNDKFENCVKFCKEQNNSLKLRKKFLEEQVKNLSEQIQTYREILSGLERIQSYVNFACDFVSQK